MAHRTKEFDLPLPVKDIGWLVDEFWPRLEEFVNAPEPKEARERGYWIEMRERLLALTKGKPPLDGFRVYPPLVLIGHKGHVQWGVVKAREWAGLKKELLFTLMLLWHPESRQRLRQCQQCRQFFLRKRKHLRAREFCSDACRYRARRSREGKAALAAYMRRYRKNPVRQAFKK